MKEVNLEEVTRRIRKMVGNRKFKPFVCYDRDDESNFITVLTADCSLTEHTVDPLLVLLERNHVEEGQAVFVGFRIEWVSAFERVEFMDDGKLVVSRILSAISIDADLRTKAAIEEICLVILKEFKLDEVNIPAK